MDWKIGGTRYQHDSSALLPTLPQFGHCPQRSGAISAVRAIPGIHCELSSASLRILKMSDRNEQTGGTGYPAKYFSFRADQHFRRGTTVFRIVSIAMPSVIIEHTLTGERKHLLQAALVSEYLSGSIVPCSAEAVARANAGDGFLEDDAPYVVRNAISILSPSAQERGLFVLKYWRALRTVGFTSLRPTQLLELEHQRIVKRFGDSNPPKLSTLYSIDLKIRKANNDLRAAFPNYSSRGGRNSTRCDQALMDALDEIIQARRDDPNAPLKFADIEKDLKAAVAEQTNDSTAILTTPSRSTISRRVKTLIDAYEFANRRNGRRAADEKYKVWHPRARAQEPLQVVEFDDKDTRTFGIDEVTSLPCGRIYITAGVDQFSSMPLGFSISHEHRNTWSAINTVANSILPKDMSQPEWSGVEREAPFFGKFGIAIFDNALYNHAHALEVAAIEMSNCAIAFARPYSPREKSIVEDWNGKVVREFLCHLPGFGGEKSRRNHLQEAEQAANVSIQEFKLLLLQWTYNVFSNTPRHGGLTPRQRWESALQDMGPMLPVDVRKIRLGAMLNLRVKLRPELIRHHDLIYQNHRVENLRRQLGHKAPIDIKYDPQNLTYVFAHDPTEDEWFMVESATREYTQGLTFLQHNLIRKMARDRGVRNPAVPQMLLQREELAKLVRQLRFSKKLKERRLGATVGNSESSEKNRSMPAMLVTELEDKINEIAQVPMDEGDDDWKMPSNDL